MVILFSTTFDSSVLVCNIHSKGDLAIGLCASLILFVVICLVVVIIQNYSFETWSKI
jgi:hypothetical protein